MKDKYGRAIDYLRISVTDRCNLRCIYCMPEEGVEMLSRCDILTFDEIKRIVGIMAELGVKKIKITGGEPLVRKGIIDLIYDLKKTEGIQQVTLTTNGVLLLDMLPELKKAGIDGINISIDSLDKEEYLSLARRQTLSGAMESLREAIRLKFNVKVNCVPLAKEDSLIKMAELAKNNDIAVRFIEMMPLGQGRNFNFISEDDMLSKLSKVYGKAQETNVKKGNGPAHYYTFPGFIGRVGFISALSHKFCSECNRIRLTADGFLKTCLQYDYGVSLKDLIRAGADDEIVKKAIVDAVNEKPQCHEFEAYKDIMQRDDRLMSQIGG